VNEGGEPVTTGRWWLNPALARLAFGRTQRATRESASTSSLMRRALRNSDTTGLDLEDPAQREFGEYELLELIGQGGMGVVYRARQRGLDREVAIKLLSAGQWASEELVESLRREARHAARLQHPNIVVVHGIGEHAGLIYYAMQLVPGRSLSQQLDDDGPMPPPAAARLLRTVAEAVDYAHRLGVLHLDLKPGNLLVDADGTPRIADFGLARRLEQALDERHVSGTPSYMAPEQALPGQAALSPATDVWALGAVLYEMLTGVPPFVGEDAAHTLRLLQDGTVRQPSRVAKVPADLEAVCLKCLAREPRRRYPGARALADDLGRYLEGRAVRARPLSAPQRIARWARREPKLAGVAAFACLALLAGVAATTVEWRRAEANALQAGRALGAQRALALQQAHALDRDFGALPGLAANLGASDDAGDTAASTLERRRLGLTLAAYPRLIDRFTLPQKLASLALSPDGRRLAVGTLETAEVLLFDTADGRELWRTSLAGEPAFFGSGNFSREIRRLRFSPDGRYLVAGNWWPTPVISPSGMDNWRIDAATGTVAHPQRRFPELLDATYSEDGRHALLRRADRHQVQLWDAERWKPLSGVAAYHPVNPAWLIAPRARFVASWIDEGIEILDPATLSRRFSIRAAEVVFTAWAVDPAARHLALGNGRGAVFLADPATGALRRLLPGPAAKVHWLQFSGDGHWLVAGSEDGSIWLWTDGDGFSAGRRLDVDAPVWNVTADPATGLVRAGDAEAVGLWQLSGAGEAGAALPRAPWFRHAREIGRFASDLHPASGLLASASLDGEVRLWRLPRTPLRAGAGPVQMTSTLDFDGTHYVAVDGSHAQVVRADDDRPASPAFLHPRPVGFAALSADGTLLVTSSGPELHVFDWRRRQLRFPPLALPNSPMKLALQGDRAYVTYTVDRGHPLTEAVAAYSLDDGRALAKPREVTGGITAMVPTPDGNGLALLAGEAVELLDAPSLRLAGRGMRGDAAEQVNAVAASQRPAIIATATASPDGVRLHDPSARTSTFAATAEPPAAIALSSDGAMHVAFLPGNRLVQLHNGVSTRTIDAPSGTQFARSAAFSRDGRVLAQGLVDGVLLLDTQTGEWLAPPLRAPIPAPDVVAQVALGPDGSRLLARTAFGRWLWWRLDPDLRPSAEIAREARNLSPVRGASARPSAGERRLLRAMDAGAVPQALPVYPAGSCLDPAPPLPPRDARTPARLLDLAPPTAINPRRHSREATTLGIANLCGLPLGRQRMGGVDFDVRATIRPDPATLDALYALRAAGGKGGLPIASIAVPDTQARVAAFELLATSPTFIQDPMPETLPVQANLVVHYADGGVARLPLRYGRDMTMWTERPPAASKVAWRLLLPRVEGGNLHSRTVDLYRVRLANPHPERRVRSLDIEAMPVTWNGIAILAITIDPATSRGRGGLTRRAAAPRPAPRAKAAAAVAPVFRACGTASGACRPDPRPAP
jgi:WD40 repeat protein/tRNA A-37 threonylcarbamoyl transferase component Bud32